MSLKPQTLLITLSGNDRPGITSQIMQVLTKHNAKILDIAQAVIHRLLSLSLVFECEADITAELTKAANTLKLTLKILPLEEGVTHSSQASHYAVTLIGDHVSAASLSKVTEALASEGANIDTIKRMSEGGFSCVEMGVSFAEKVRESAMKKDLLEIAKSHQIDIAFQAEGLYRRAKRLVVMDMDSTLIQSEVIDELAREKGVYDEVARITAGAMAGKLDFDQSLTKRCDLLKGMTTAQLEKVFQSVALTPGAADLIFVLKKLGYKIALISGGFTFVAERLKDQLGIHFAYANTLEIKEGKLTGKVIPPIINAQRKADLLDVIAQQEKIELDQVIAIGDGANDIPMLERAGLGIAFNAKPAVKARADLAISQKNLRSVLFLLGLSERDLSQAGLTSGKLHLN